MTSKTNYAAQKRYAKKNKERGSARVTVWIPEKYAEELKEIAASMRTGAWEE